MLNFVTQVKVRHDSLTATRSSERITFMEELSRGAFGKVNRGALRELPTVEIFDKPRDQRVEIKEAKVVAIKTLLGDLNDIYGTILDCYIN